MYKFGFIGTGNMGGALAKAVSKKINPADIIICDKCAEKAEALASEIRCDTGNIFKTVSESDYVFLGVKPQFIKSVTDEINSFSEKLQRMPIFVSMLAGTSIEYISGLFDSEVSIIRIMPNIACSVGKGVVLCSRDETVSDERFDYFKSSMEFSGIVDEINEKFIDAYSALSGCAPAYAFMFIESLADGAVSIGVPRDKAYLYAAKVLDGSASLMIESGNTPAVLKDAVCSPGGTTIQGVRALESGSFRSSVIESIISAYNKTKELNG